MFPKCFQVESLNQLEKIYIWESLPEQLQSRCSWALNPQLLQWSYRADRSGQVWICGDCDEGHFREKEQECSVCFPWISQGWKTVMPQLPPHRARCAPAGWAAQSGVSPGWLCSPPAGPGSAADSARPPLCQPPPVGPPPSSAPAAAAAASVCSRLWGMYRKVYWEVYVNKTWIQQINRLCVMVRCCEGAHTVLWDRPEFYRWALGFFWAPVWACLSLHTPN